MIPNNIQSWIATSRQCTQRSSYSFLQPLLLNFSRTIALATLTKFRPYFISCVTNNSLAGYVFGFVETWKSMIWGRECCLRARMLWGVTEYLFVSDRPAVRLGEDLRLRGLKGGQTCLDAYGMMAKLNLDRRRLNYKIRPKWFSSFAIGNIVFFFSYRKPSKHLTIGGLKLPSRSKACFQPPDLGFGKVGWEQQVSQNTSWGRYVGKDN